MQGRIRRVITGHDAQGKAVVVSDGAAPAVRTNPLRPGHVSTDLWKTGAAPVVLKANMDDPTGGPKQIHPLPGGTVFRISELAPEPEAVRNLDPERAREVFKAMGNEGAATFGRGGRHPMMHRTETIDYAVVLEGRVTLVLDDQDVELEAGDVVIQCGTNHAWSNRSDKPCRMLYVLIDGTFDPALAAQHGVPETH
ncbi:MAG: cupin domain-containing protein [Rhodocyclaceae bacterium]|jgi:quercetin dioxygenase-like cupin family protein|nr:cupin domain-containing protein [Rhodocyclaceae bacterium]MCA3074812.1 cupin domain-containing protein [Rhodocyclaceae bacterium]MCA3090861.1 cupin domain-containing protein [Rhodocyclaceae bacterium]MCA3095460.1 cupin domain-containing protein [Rhodocyclaceae bacterium]MCA3099699.1 cupin domain-containing protein [Rhodocyclaceae bacterium]